MADQYPPTGFSGNPGQAYPGTYRSTRAGAVERQPWSPAQAVAIALGVVFLVMGGIVLARTGVDFNRLTSQHVSVAGSTQTQLFGYLELIYGALLLVVGSIPGAGRGGMSFLGVLALVFGIVVVAQPSTFHHSLGIGSGYGTFLIVVGAVLMLTSMIAPIYWGFSRHGWQASGPARRAGGPTLP